ncbi:MAG: universal stress protein [Candidatus Marinimicrobia bacterium]|jgi:nucleotide-binding universal stress UspA family protein|nr:universal stress protein [Candidatus Neomarinimicrobiota bacterium]MBT3617457.1 universal stress protein [Candidatus Neomarinimicrobiota bacterium]MBT3829397.1 universal stress protein [Candidatus Neomarinimicrobiota bacterium]MBT3997680.1 universal stress protein [Candidatus Neomarinimicrobiota bacterium]MBT4280978.1 universal stress protein [Candidatus Neomarinimicrobiota bacterium]
MSYNTILVALCGRGDEADVIGQAVTIAEMNHANLIAVHVNEPHAGEMSMMMDSPGRKLDEEDIRERFRAGGFNEMADKVVVEIISDERISKILTKMTEDADLLVLGHRRMSTFKSNLMDSIDEGIVNHAKCPVLVVPK